MQMNVFSRSIVTGEMLTIPKHMKRKYQILHYYIMRQRMNEMHSIFCLYHSSLSFEFLFTINTKKTTETCHSTLKILKRLLNFLVRHVLNLPYLDKRSENNYFGNAALLLLASAYPILDFGWYVTLFWKAIAKHLTICINIDGCLYNTTF